MHALRDLLQPDRPTAIVDVGANQLDAKPPYQRMLDEGLCTVVGFEPQPEALERLIKGKGPSETYLPHAIGNGQMRMLHLCEFQGMTSFLEPDQKALDAFAGASKWGKVNQIKPLPTIRLDDVAEVQAIDLLKADVQGFEIEVLRSGRYKLTKAVAVQVEMSFMPVYKDQPTFAHVDLELRSMGFVPHCFAGASLMPIATETPVPHCDPHQLLESDMLYVRDFTKPMDLEQWKHLAMVAHHVSGSFDLAMLAVSAVAKLRDTPSDPETYRQILEQK